ncbi:MAG: hypothetical protein FJY97_17020, partial [candidate division Zixibacteria bacterium]|nr:hypothetical protein [candidate division Zixibacteria bacterium]
DPALGRLCKTRWQLWHRRIDGWRTIRNGDHYDEREPCPLVRCGERLLLSVNPLIDRTIASGGGKCSPYLLEWPADDPARSPVVHHPVWDKVYDSFCEHSYRGIGTDPDAQTVLLLHIDAHQGYAWSFMDPSGAWPHQGFLTFPIRACYPQVGLRGYSAHVLAVGDIVETREDWRSYKRQMTGNAWDYDFRSLFYTWTPDLRSIPFHTPLEIASHENTAGHIRNSDLWIDADGSVHILFTAKNIWHDFMRDRFFPGTPIVSTLEYRMIKNGNIIRSHTLTSHVKDKTDTAESGIIYTGAAFHAGPDATLRAVYCQAGKGMYLMQIYPWIGDTPVCIPLKRPIDYFFIPAPRNGSDLTRYIDLYGMNAGSNGLYYARVNR